MKEYKSKAISFTLKAERMDFNQVKIASSQDAAQFARQFYFDDIEIFESVFIILLNAAGKSPVWLVSDEVATKMQEKHPFFDYGVIKDPVFRVEDTETGNAVIYIGESLPEAIGTILSDESPEMWDLYAGDSRIWCGKTDTIKELKSL